MIPRQGTNLNRRESLAKSGDGIVERDNGFVTRLGQVGNLSYIAV